MKIGKALSEKNSEPELRPEFIKKMKEREKEGTVKVQDFFISGKI